MKIEVDENTVKKVAFLARLKLSDEEIRKYAEDLKSILESFHTLQQVNVDDVDPSFQPVPIKNVTRDDEERESIPQEVALSNTSNREDGYFKGPKIIEK